MILHPGTTAIVGPNGSGKSNIGEAIVWILGEHNPHNLRCLSASELVYNGNGLLRPQNYAEVNLVINNEEGGLPLAFPEVQITRRVDRSGEGECFINRARCRLRDVQELFLDTGLGHRGYWVMSQTQIDSVLSIKPEARRELLEEAAGTSRYRFRRQEVLRKLDATERNLVRLRDILAEVQAQLEPLAEEAEKASKYRESSSRLRELELAYLLDESQSVVRQLQQLELTQNDLTDKLTLAQTEKLRAAEERLSLDRQEQELEPALDQLRQQVAEAAARRQRFQAEMMVAQAELRQVSREQQEAGEEEKHLLASWEQAKSRLNQIEHSLLGEKDRLERLLRERQEKAGTLALAQGQRQVADEERQTLESELQELEPQLDQLRQRLGDLDGQRHRLQAEMMAAQSELEQVRLRQQNAKTEAEQLVASLEQSAARAQKIETALKTEDDLLQRLRQAVKEKTDDLAKAKQAASAQVWETIQEGLETATAEAGELQRRASELLALIEAGAKEEAAHAGQALAADLSSLRNRLSLLAESRHRRDEAEALRERLASELAKLGGELRALEERMLTRREELQAANQQALSLERLASQKHDAQAGLQTIALAAEEELTARDAALQHAEDVRSELQTQLAELSARHSSLRESLASSSGARQRREQAEALRERLAFELSELVAEVKVAEERITSRQAALEAARAQALSLENARALNQDAAKALHLSVQEAEATLAEHRKQLEQAENDWSRLQATLAELSQERSLISQRAFLARDAERKAAAQEDDLSGRLHQAELRRARLESRLQAVQERLALDFGFSQSSPPAEALASDGSPQQVAPSVPSDFDRAAAEKEIASLREQLSLLGEVNLGSIYHHERLSERKTFLQEQILDLEQGRESLLKALQELDQRTRSQFLAAFRKAGEEFQRLFQRLFGGGETEFVLTDPANLLETGVDIKVRLPGKEMTNLPALSGGERSLTAIAFLFSLLMVRPSPFCVLDEVDAALDETNTRKFSSLLREMSARTQFLVITHNPLTMESADYLYGVTVGHSGSSKLLSVRLS